MSAPSPPRSAPLALWRLAQTFLHTFFALFGAPEHIAEQHTFTPGPRKLLLKWLRIGEALMRYLLLIEAAAYAKPNTRPLLRQPRRRVRKLRGFDADKPEAWRVSLRCFSSPTLPQAQGDAMCSAARSICVSPSLSRANHAEPRRFHSAWPLAERTEAMLRVFNDPAPYAARLARRLHATPHRARELTRVPENLEHVIDEHGFANLREAVVTARRRIESG